MTATGFLLLCSLVTSTEPTAAGPTSEAAPPAAAEPDLRAQFAGTFHYAGDEREKEARQTAIADSTNGVFFLIRGIVGSRVNEKTQVAPYLRFAFPSGQVQAGSPNRPDILTPDDGKAVPLKIDNEVIQVAQAFRGNALVQIFTAVDGVRTNEMVLDPSGQVLKVRVVVKSSKLPHPLEYHLTYKR